MFRSFSALTAGLVAGALAFSVGMPAAGAQASTACGQIEATLTNIQKALPKAASGGAAALASKIKTYATQLETEAASASPTVKSAVTTFVTDLEAVASGKVNVPKLTADANAIGSACAAPSKVATAPSRAPFTGAGSTAGLQDKGLILGGAAALAAGIPTIGFGLRRRRAKLASRGA